MSPEWRHFYLKRDRFAGNKPSNMHLFYTPDIEGLAYTLNPEESKHCVRVLRLAVGDNVSLVDGRGNWYNGKITIADIKGCSVECHQKIEKYGQRPFCLHIAVAPTKNIDRTEWMLEKCTEIGIEEITLLNCCHSERKTVKDDRLEKVIISATKQSLKAYLPQLNPMVDFKTFIKACKASQKYIAHCREGVKQPLDQIYKPGSDVIILIGPEGDFSEEEVKLAEQNGFIPVTLGTSRLRTETAGIVACHTINLINKV